MLRVRFNWSRASRNGFESALVDFKPHRSVSLNSLNYPHPYTSYPHRHAQSAPVQASSRIAFGVMPAPTVLITEPLAPEPLAWINARARVIQSSPETLDCKDLAQAQGLIVRTYTNVTPELLDRAPGLRVVGRAGVGLDNIDLDACRSRDIRVVHTPNANAHSVVEYVIANTIGSLRSIQHVDTFHDERAWRTLRDGSVSPRSCVGATLGIIGLGNIGSRVASAARALGMHVIYHDIREIPEDDRNGAQSASLEELATQSDIITIHVDGRVENTRIFDATFFGRLRESVILINASRGFVIDTQAAIEFANSHQNAQLVLDVHDPEPIPEHSALWSQRNVLLTPHIASGTRQAKEAMSWVVLDVMRVLEGQQPAYGAV
jgi:(S)-sulfolactate dehydrogenase